jgi:hypothetical protein
MIFVDCDIPRSSRDGSRPAWRRLGRKQFPLKRIGFYSAAKCMNGIHKLIDILKALVHGGVTQICHLIDPA